MSSNVFGAQPNVKTPEVSGFGSGGVPSASGFGPGAVKFASKAEFDAYIAAKVADAKLPAGFRLAGAPTPTATATATATAATAAAVAFRARPKTPAEIALHVAAKLRNLKLPAGFVCAPPSTEKKTDCTECGESKLCLTIKACGHPYCQECFAETVEGQSKTSATEWRCTGRVAGAAGAPKTVCTTTLTGCSKMKLTKDNKARAEKGFVAMMLARRMDLMRCPHCQAVLPRPHANASNKVISCLHCKNRHCTWCNHSTNGASKCTNVACTDHPILHKLKTCGTKTIGTSIHGVPTVRLCPNPACQRPHSHVQACKHINNCVCKVPYCFVCLRGVSNGQWQCGGAYEMCPGGVAPRQTKFQGT